MPYSKMKAFAVISLVLVYAGRGSDGSSSGSSSGSSEGGVIQNIALNKPATQSSTYGLSWGASWGASNVVDGNTNPNMIAYHCSHTEAQVRPWWKVDLGDSYDISKIIVYNRGDCCALRIIDATIRVGNNGNSFKDNTEVGRILYKDSVYTFELDPPQTGRYVSVQIESTRKEYLQLCEVKVFGRKS